MLRFKLQVKLSLEEYHIILILCFHLKFMCPHLYCCFHWNFVYFHRLHVKSVSSLSFLSRMLPFLMSWNGLCVCVSRAEALQSQGEEGTVVVEEQVEPASGSAQGAGQEGEVGGAAENPEGEGEEEEPERSASRRPRGHFV